MSSHIASFDEFESDAQIAAHQAGLILVVLEGRDDVLLFERFWFRQRRDVFEFVEARHVAAAAGCTAVADGVRECARLGVSAVGVVDRDTFFREKDWDALFRCEGGLSMPDALIGNVYVTDRWEVEAYLLEADGRLASWVSSQHRNPPGPERMCREANRITLQACETLLSAAPFFASMHARGAPVAPGWCCDVDAAKVEDICTQRILESDPEFRQVAEKVAALISGVASAAPDAEGERLPYLLRYVDTKRLIKRLVHSLQIQENIWFLADLMLREGRQPGELDELLTKVEIEVERSY